MKKFSFKNIIFFAIIALLIIPQTRKPIQVFVQKGLAMFSPSVKNEENRIVISNYNWKLKDINGNIYNFNEVKNKVVLINFWATWCPPCIAEMPSLQKLYNDYNGKVEFLFVTNEKAETIKEFMLHNNYSFKVFNPLNDNPEFQVSSIPRTFLISKEGEIVIDKTGAANWNSKAVREQIDLMITE